MFEYTKAPQPFRRFKPRSFLLWDNSANHCTSLICSKTNQICSNQAFCLYNCVHNYHNINTCHKCLSKRAKGLFRALCWLGRSTQQWLSTAGVFIFHSREERSTFSKWFKAKSDIFLSQCENNDALSHSKITPFALPLLFSEADE